MKILNIVLLSVAGGLLLSILVSSVSRALLGESGVYVALPLALIIGLNARRGAEKILGYTIAEASKGLDDENP